ncbi:MAG: hypothetical protein HYS12_23515 [Planctomycetes bacterium]|nr:hypothetical protein [Planctomycetota bacterium]
MRRHCWTGSTPRRRPRPWKVRKPPRFPPRSCRRRRRLFPDEAQQEAPAPAPAGVAEGPEGPTPPTAAPLPEPAPAPETIFSTSGFVDRLFNFTTLSEDRIQWTFRVVNRPAWQDAADLVAPVIRDRLQEALAGAVEMGNSRDLLSRQKSAAQALSVARAKVREKEAGREVLVSEAPADLARRLLEWDAELVRLRQEASQREDEAGVLLPLAQQAGERLRQFAEAESKRLTHQRMEELRDELRTGLQKVLDMQRQQFTRALIVMVALRDSPLATENLVNEALAALQE